VPGLHKRASAVSLRRCRPSPSSPSDLHHPSDFRRRADYIHAERGDSSAGFGHLRSAPVDAFSQPAHSPVESSSPPPYPPVRTSGRASDPSQREPLIYRTVDRTVHAPQHVLPPKAHPYLPPASEHDETSCWSDSAAELPIPSPSATESTSPRRSTFRSGKRSLIRLGTKKSVPEPKSSKPAPLKAPKPNRLASLWDLSVGVYSTYI